MSLRLWIGGSGQGKTHALMEHIIASSMEHSKKQYYMIVPEQFGLETQHHLIKQHPDHGFFNVDVLSFHRLAYRVFDECEFQPDDILEDLGVSMILRKLLHEHEADLQIFKKSAKKAGFIDELKSMLMELICYGVTAEQMQQMGEALKEHPNLSRKCTELGKIYAHFEQYIAGRFMVSEQILDRVTELVPRSQMLKQGTFYFDGYTGFTPVQLTFLGALLREGAELHISVNLSASTLYHQGASVPVYDVSFLTEDLFYMSRKNIKQLQKLCRDYGACMEDPVLLDREIPWRFVENKELAFLEHNLFQTQKSWTKEPETLHVVACYNPEAEAEFITHKIEQLVRQKGYRYRDFAVLVGSAEEYASAFRRQCDILHIPFFEDSKKKMSYYAGVETIRALFHLAQMDYSYESVFRYLKCGMSSFSEEEIDLLENYVLSAGVRGRRMWSEPFRRRLYQYEDEKIEQLQELRARFVERTGVCCGILKSKKKTVVEKMTVLFETLVGLDYRKKLLEMAKEAEEEGNYSKMRACERLYPLLMELFDKIVAIFGEDKLSIEELSEIVDAGLEAMGLGVEPLSMDQMILGDLKRTRLPEIKVLFVAGMNDGKIPANLEDRGLIQDEEKQILSERGITLSDNLMEQSLEEEFYIYQALTRPSDALYFSYSGIGKDGGSLRPSTLFDRLRRMYPKLATKWYPKEEIRYFFNKEDSKEKLIHGLHKLHYDKETAMSDRVFLMLLKYWYDQPLERPRLEYLWKEKDAIVDKENLGASLARALYGQEIVGSVTRLEKFASCPYHYFCTYGLELKERQEYKVRALDIGNIFHSALEHYAKLVKESPYHWRDIPDEIQEGYMEQGLQLALDENMADLLQSTARNKYKISMIRRILRKTIKMLQKHLAHSEFEPDHFELRFGRQTVMQATKIPLEHGGRMSLEGVIDRVDICETDDQIFVKIIDYKTGLKSFELEDFYYGLDLQLVIYMNAAKEFYEQDSTKQIVPAGMFYYHVKDPIESVEGAVEESPLKAFRMSGYVNDDPENLKHFERLEEGDKDFVQAKVSLTKSGKPSKRSCVLHTEDFAMMGSYARTKAARIGNSIYSGEIKIKPYKNSKRTACDYCPYHSVCGFDPKIDGYQYKQFEKMSAEEVLEALRKEED